jgi:uncharacterized protein DUF3606
VCIAITPRRARKFLIARPFLQASASRNKSCDLTLRSRSGVEVIAMADDKTKRGPADCARINSNEDYELEYRAKEWGVSRSASGRLCRQSVPWPTTSSGISARECRDREERA